MPRWIGLDYGAKRIGVALGDWGHRLAFADRALPGSGRLVQDAESVLRFAADQEPAGFVVGLPLNMDGTDSAQTRHTRAFAAALAERTPLPVELWDERLSSFQADQQLDEAGIGGARRRGRRDALAAQVILQAFLDARRGPPPAPGSERG